MNTVLVYGMKNVVGGVENYLLMMYRNLGEQIRFIFLVESEEELIFRKEIEQRKGEIVYLPNRHSIRAYINSYKSVLESCKGKIDCVYINVDHISFDIVPILIARKAGFRVITHSHNAMQEPIADIRYRLRQKILHSIATFVLGCTRIERLAVSEKAGNYLYRGKPYHLVFPGIETERFRFRPETREAVRSQLELENCLVLGFVGRLVAVKNPLYLLDVLKEVNQMQPAKLLVVGDGDMKEEMQARAAELNLAERVVFVGAVHNVEDYLQAMDVMLAPSLSEGLSIVMIEAQCSGLPGLCAKDRVPEMIDVTGNIKFESLEVGSKQWAADVVRMAETAVDKSVAAAKIEASDFNIQNAARRLARILIGNGEGGKTHDA